MNRKLGFALGLFLLFPLSYVSLNVVKAGASISLLVRNLNTGLNYATVQDAIDANETLDGHRITVENGTYYEHVVLYKSLMLIGENNAGTIIDGNGTGILMQVNASFVAISGFTFRNSGLNYGDCGVLIENSHHDNFSDNIITDNIYGIRLVNSTGNGVTDNVAFEDSVAIYLWNSSYNRITRNNIAFINNSGVALWQASSSNDIQYNSIAHSNCTGIYTNNSNNNTIAFNKLSSNEGGVYLRESSNNTVASNNITLSTMTGLSLETITGSRISFNTITHNPYGIASGNTCTNTFEGNTIAYNEYGLSSWNSSHNGFCHNNFVHNDFQDVCVENCTSNLYDNGLEGNYWSDFWGKDSNKDGISDLYYVVYGLAGIDNFPLIGPFSSFSTRTGQCVNVISNSTIEDFLYSESSDTIEMHVSNMTTDQTFGFCRVCIPHSLMNQTYHVFVNAAEPIYVNYTLYDNGTHRWIYFGYAHSRLEIIIIPEFPSFLILPPLMVVMLFAGLFHRRKRYVSHKSSVQAK